MSEWDSWVNFVSATAEEEFRSADPNNDTPAVFHIRLGGMEGGIAYAQSPAFDVEFESEDVAKLSKQSAGETTDIFENAPKGFLVYRCIPCTISGESISVVVGKQKGNSARQFFASVSNSCSVIAMVDITNNNRGAENLALNAFALGVVKGMENGI